MPRTITLTDEEVEVISLLLQSEALRHEAMFTLYSAVGQRAIYSDLTPPMPHGINGHDTRHQFLMGLVRKLKGEK